MSRAKPIHMLTHEHHYILKVVNALDVLGPDLASGKAMDVSLFRQIIAFMRDFADSCHHAKEEDLLFPAMIELGIPESGCPIGGLKAEHTQGRKLVNLLEKGVDLYDTEPDRAREITVEAIRGIVKLYPNHIWKEDEMVFPMAEKLFNSGDLGHLEKAFERVEEEKGSDHDLYARFAIDLEKRTVR